MYVLYVLHTDLEYSIPFPQEIWKLYGMECGFHIHFPPWNGPLVIVMKIERNAPTPNHFANSNDNDL